MIVDINKCNGCYNCFLACKDEYTGNDYPPYSVAQQNDGRPFMKMTEKEMGKCPQVKVDYIAQPCLQCRNATCVKMATDGEVYRRPDGIVIIDPTRAKGQKQLVDACPYGHIWWNGELDLPQAWPFDAHLIDQGWQQTRGQQSCPTGAMRAVKVEDAEMERLAREQELEVMGSAQSAKPRVYYKNLWRYTRCFIGGTISAAQDGIVDCVEGAAVRLLKNNIQVAETTSDNYGDFKFDRLEEGSGHYRVEVMFSGRAKKAIDVDLGVSANLGEIRL